MALSVGGGAGGKEATKITACAARSCCGVVFWDGQQGAGAFESDMAKYKRKPVPGSFGDFLSQYYPDYSAGLAYKYPQAWTDEEKRNFNPSFLPKGLQPDNASSVHANGISLNVISIPEFPRPQARELKPKKVILPEQNG